MRSIWKSYLPTQEELNESEDYCSNKGYIFVFGSNEAGIHGAGAAAAALAKYGAKWGVGFGHVGNSFAIPSKNGNFDILTLDQISKYAGDFVKYAEEHPDLKFYVTRIGCGLAGFDDSDIAPLFENAPINCKLPKGWRND